MRMKIFSLLVENLSTATVMLLLMDYKNALFGTLSIASGSYILITLCCYTYLHRKHTIENEAKEFYESKKREIEAANKIRGFIDFDNQNV